MEFDCPKCKSINIILDTSDNTFCLNCGKNNTVEINKKIKEIAVNENIEKAYIEFPQSFIPSELIYLNGKINDHEIKLLIDTGATRSVISNNFALACGIEHLIDTSVKGALVGVGTCKTLGKIHYLEVNIGGHDFPCSFLVAENDKLDAIIGIDTMRHLGLNINFDKKHISIYNETVIIPFE